MQKYFPRSLRKPYKDRSFVGTDEQYEKLLSETCTLYIGNLPLTTKEERLWTIFSDMPIRRIIMGLNKNNLLFCGFAFVEFYNHSDCQKGCVATNQMMIDGTHVRVDMDYGFVEGRQFGRGFAGGSFIGDIKKRGPRRDFEGKRHDDKKGDVDVKRRFFGNTSGGGQRERYFDNDKRRISDNDQKWTSEEGKRRRY